MDNPREIKSRIDSINDTRKITNAMYLISSTKLRKAKEELDHTRAHFNALRDEIKRIFRTVKDLDSKYLYPENMANFKNGTYGVLVITADRGLAGAYNLNVIKETQKLMEEHSDCRLFVIGEYGRQYFKRRNIPIEEDFYSSPQDPTLEQARQIAAYLLDLYDNGKLKKLFVVYTDFANSMDNKTILTRLLPFHREVYDASKVEKKVEHEFTFFPSPENVLNSVIESYVAGFIYGALVDSFSSEQNSRMNAMSSANSNAESLLVQLSKEYNQIRQQMITQQITEVSAGSKAQRHNRNKRR